MYLKPTCYFFDVLKKEFFLLFFNFAKSKASFIFRDCVSAKNAQILSEKYLLQSRNLHITVVRAKTLRMNEYVSKTENDDEDIFPLIRLLSSFLL